MTKADCRVIIHLLLYSTRSRRDLRISGEERCKSVAASTTVQSDRLPCVIRSEQCMPLTFLGKKSAAVRTPRSSAAIWAGGAALSGSGTAHFSCAEQHIARRRRRIMKKAGLILCTAALAFQAAAISASAASPHSHLSTHDIPALVAGNRWFEGHEANSQVL